MDNQPLKIIHILDRNSGRIVATLDNTEKNVFWGAEHVQALQGENVFEFYTDAPQLVTEHMTGNFRALIPKDGGGWSEMIAFETDIDEDVFFARMIGAESMHDKEKVIEPKDWLAQDAASFAAITATETYKPGVIEYNGIQAISATEYVGPFTFNKRIAATFDLELQYRTETDGYDVTGRFFDMVKRIGVDEGKIFEPGKDLISLKKTVNNEDVVTALYCVGPERDDGTRLTAFVTNEEALQNWGWNGEHIIGIYEPQSEDQTMSLEQLRGYGTKELNKRIAALISYEVPVESLEHIYAHERARLGDSVGIVHPFFNPPIYAEARVIQIKRRIDAPEIKVLTIGEIVELKKEDVLKTFMDLQKKFGMRIIRSEAPPKGDVTKLWIQIIPGQDLEIPHVWDAENGVWVRVAPATPEEIGAEPKIPTGKVAPLNPIAGESKWVDTSGAIPILKIWNGTIWTAVEGPPGKDGYTPIHGVDYFDGQPGQDGTDGTSAFIWVRYSQNADGSGFTDSPVNAKYIGVSVTQIPVAPVTANLYNWTLIKGTDGLPGEPGEDGRTSYLHIKYSNNGGTTFTSNNGEDVGEWIGTYVDFNAADSNLTSAYTWNKVKGEKGEPGYTPVKGTDYFDGKPGLDGKSSYLWVRYSINANGNPMTTTPAGAKYIGVAVTQTASAPELYTGYNWTLIKGTDGLPGEPGTDGKTSYLHIKYSNDGGATFTANSGETVGDWIGTYVDFTAADSMAVSAYAWNRVKGDKGDPGYTPVKGTDYFDGKAGQDGKSAYLWIRYSQNANGNPMVTSPVGAKYIGVATTMTATEPSGYAAYSWTLIKGTDGLPGEPGADGKTSYLHIKYSNDGGITFTANSGEAVGDWIGTYVDFVAADSNSPAAYTWNKVKGEKGDNGYTPVKGTDYFDGKDGKDGLSSYLWIRYSQNANGNPMVTSPTGAKYVGIATTTTASAPDSYASYSWSLIKGTDGLPGEPGDNGQTSYLHIKYSNDGGATFTANAGETAGDWIGTYVDFTAADSLSVSAYTWNKVKGDKGDPGDNAPLVKLDASSQVFKVTAAGAISPASITITGTGINTIITAWTYSVNGGSFTATLPAGVTRSGNIVTVNGSTFTGNTLSVKASNGIVADTFTIAKVTDGAKGGIGNPGADAYTVLLTNESHVFAGGVTAAIAGNTTSQVIAYKGASAISPTSVTVGALPTGMTASVSGSTVTVTVTTSMTSKSGTIPLTIVVDGKTFTRNMSYAIAFEGAKGNPGDPGSAGKGITSIAEQYYLSTAATTPTGGSWQASPPAWIDGRFMFTRSVIVYTDGTNTTTLPVNVTGGTGGTGTPGVGITKVDVMYYLSTSATGLSGGTWATTAPTWIDGRYMWSKTVTTFTNGTTNESAAVNITGAKGNPGDTGPGGRNVVSVTKQYYLSTSSTALSGGTWTDTAPALLTGRFMWERLKTTYSNPAGADYGTANLSAEWAGITSAQKTADGKNTVFHSTSQPSTSGRINGDVWFDTDDGNKMYRFLSGAWTAAQFGENAIVANSITATHIKSLAGLNVNDQFIVDSNGNVTFKGNLNGAGGTFNGKVVISGINDHSEVQTITVDKGELILNNGYDIQSRHVRLTARSLMFWGISTRSVDEIEYSAEFGTGGVFLKGYGYENDMTTVEYGAKRVNRTVSGYITSTLGMQMKLGAGYHFELDTGGGESFRTFFPANNHAYMTFYEATKRVAYMGYGFNSTNTFTFNNERRTNPSFEFIGNGTDGSALDIRFSTVESWNHHTIRAGQVTLKFLNSTSSALQIKNRADTAYAELHAKIVNVTSHPKFKKNLRKVDRPFLSEFLKYQVQEYNFISDTEGTPLSIGLRADNAPNEILSVDGEMIDIYGQVNYLWKVVGELVHLLVESNTLKEKDINGKERGNPNGDKNS